MPDDNPLPWSDRQWDDLRAVALEAARKSRVASTFLPLVGPVPADRATVPSNWQFAEPAAGVHEPRLAVRSGRTLQLVTLSCNIYLRGSEIADPDLDAAKSMIRRAGEVLGRLEDAVVFYGLPPEGHEDERFDRRAIKPEIYTITGGDDLTGLLHAPEMALVAETGPHAAVQGPVAVRQAGISLVQQGQGLDAAALRGRYQAVEDEHEGELMCVRLGRPPDPAALAAPGAAAGGAPLPARARGLRRRFRRRRDDAGGAVAAGVAAGPVPPGAAGAVAGGDAGRGPVTGTELVSGIVDAIQRLETRGHFGPFAVVLGHNLFRIATSPNKSLVLPTDRLAEFLDGRRVQRSGVLPPDRGVVVALGGQPIELVLASDIDVRFLQATLEPRYVVRVFERLVLRIKELDAVCCVTTDQRRLDPEIIARRAR